MSLLCVYGWLNSHRRYARFCPSGDDSRCTDHCDTLRGDPLVHMHSLTQCNLSPLPQPKSSIQLCVRLCVLHSVLSLTICLFLLHPLSAVRSESLVNCSLYTQVIRLHLLSPSVSLSLSFSLDLILIDAAYEPRTV